MYSASIRQAADILRPFYVLHSVREARVYDNPASIATRILKCVLGDTRYGRLGHVGDLMHCWLGKIRIRSLLCRRHGRDARVTGKGRDRALKIRF
jgi:hypothetical protein